MTNQDIEAIVSRVVDTVDKYFDPANDRVPANLTERKYQLSLIVKRCFRPALRKARAQ